MRGRELGLFRGIGVVFSARFDTPTSFVWTLIVFNGIERIEYTFVCDVYVLRTTCTF